MVLGTVKLLHQQKPKISLGIKRVAGLNRLLKTVDNSTGKCASGKDKFGSVIDSMYMKLGGKFLSSLRVKT